MTKVKKVVLQNFKGFDQVEVNFDENITYLVGKNGSGKSTIGVDAIWAALQGIAERPANSKINPIIGSRFLFLKDPEKPATIFLYLRDEKLKTDITIKRTITERETKVTFEGPESIKLDQQWLNELFNSFLISPRKFIALTPKEQALAIGIDLSDVDAEIKAKKAEITDVNAQIKAIGQLVPVPEVQRVNLQDLLDKRGLIVEFNALQDQKQTRIDKITTQVNEVNRQLEEARKKVAELELRVKNGNDMLKGAEQPLPKTSLVEIDKDLAEADMKNQEAGAWKTYNDKKTRYDECQVTLSKFEGDKDKLIKTRLEKIQSMKLPFANLSVNEEGELMFDGRYIKREYFSDGELISMVPVILTQKDQDFKYVYIQDFNLLDEDNQKKVTDYLTKHGFQLVIEYIGKPQPGMQNVIELKNFKIVGNESE
jgi:DNA repair exonuclease SbcCD ATPase subunit